MLADRVLAPRGRVSAGVPANPLERRPQRRLLRGSGAEQVDWKPTRSYEDEVRLELEDVDQMIEAQNERRRASGRPEISEDQIRAEVEQEERWRKEEAERYRGKHPEG